MTPAGTFQRGSLGLRPAPGRGVGRAVLWAPRDPRPIHGTDILLTEGATLSSGPPPQGGPRPEGVVLSRGIYTYDVRVLLHTIAVRRARSVVGICDLLSSGAATDAEVELLRTCRREAVALQELLETFCVDFKDYQQIGLF